MAATYRRMTFMLTPEIEQLMDEAKRKFYNQSQSEIVRKLLMLGLKTLRDEEEKENRNYSAISSNPLLRS